MARPTEHRSLEEVKKLLRSLEEASASESAAATAPVPSADEVSAPFAVEQAPGGAAPGYATEHASADDAAAPEFGTGVGSGRDAELGPEHPAHDVSAEAAFETEFVPIEPGADPAKGVMLEPVSAASPNASGVAELAWSAGALSDRDPTPLALSAPDTSGTGKGLVLSSLAGLAFAGMGLVWWSGIVGAPAPGGPAAAPKTSTTRTVPTPAVQSAAVAAGKTAGETQQQAQLGKAPAPARPVTEAAKPATAPAATRAATDAAVVAARGSEPDNAVTLLPVAPGSTAAPAKSGSATNSKPAPSAAAVPPSPSSSPPRSPTPPAKSDPVGAKVTIAQATLPQPTTPPASAPLEARLPAEPRALERAPTTITPPQKSLTAAPVRLRVAPNLIASPGQSTPLPIGIEGLAAGGPPTVIVLGGLPAGFRFNAGVAVANGLWSLTVAEAASLAVIAPADAAPGRADLSVELRTLTAEVMASTTVALVIAATSPPSRPAMSDSSRIDETETAHLLAEGRRQLDSGQVAQARLLFRRAADAGNGEAARQLGDSFDPAKLFALGVRGIAGDIEQAIYWYERADELGDPHAKARLLSLSGTR